MSPTASTKNTSSRLCKIFNGTTNSKQYHMTSHMIHISMFTVLLTVLLSLLRYLVLDLTMHWHYRFKFVYFQLLNPSNKTLHLHPSQSMPESILDVLLKIFSLAHYYPIRQTHNSMIKL